MPDPSSRDRDALESLSVVLPALNEADALRWLLPRMPDGAVPVVVDNDSTDDTAGVAEALGARVVVEHTRGFGAACWAGLCAARTEYVAFMDADGSLDPADLPAVVAPVAADAADLVLGRRVPESRRAMPVHALAANAYLARRLRRHGAPVHDIGPMRAARTDPLRELGISDRRFGWPLEMVVRAADAGWRISEVDVRYGTRRGGRSKVTGTISGTLRAVLDMRRVLRDLGA